jgi:crossover junction endodeoxyribonuclease RusA
VSRHLTFDAAPFARLSYEGAVYGRIAHPEEAPVRLTLPLPPGVNNQYVTVGHKRVLSKEASAFKKQVMAAVENAVSHDAALLEELEEMRDTPLGIDFGFHFPSPRRRDLDGGLKIALDSLCGALGLDDRDVVDIHLAKFVDPLAPRLEADIAAIHDWQFDTRYVYLGGEQGAEGA